MRQICIWRRVALLGILAASFSYAHAADVNAHIKGTVTDPAGAVIAKASVIATNEATGIKYTTESSSTGEYLFPQLPIGTYTIKVSAPGFKEFQATGIVLNIAQEYVEPAVLPSVQPPMSSKSTPMRSRSTRLTCSSATS